MATQESTVNTSLAEVLRDTRRRWELQGTVNSECTGLIRDNKGKKPDILVDECGVPPVVVEAEFEPALKVEAEARDRLGHKLERGGERILGAVALRYPERLKNFEGKRLREELLAADDIGMALLSGEDSGYARRWPDKGWLWGGVGDLSILIQSAAIPQEVVDAATRTLEDGIRDAAQVLEKAEVEYPGPLARTAEVLCQNTGVQTWRMTAAILANALLFQAQLAGGRDGLEDVRCISELRSRGDIRKDPVLGEWKKILAEGYYPIFGVAVGMLEGLPLAYSKDVLTILADTATDLIERRLMSNHDLIGAVFQRLIADREFLGAYYTTSPSATLLAGLALSPDATPNGGAWSDAEAVAASRVGDFSCGTGTLLSAAYHRLGQLYELAGGDAAGLHEHAIEHSMIGCDVLPSATHLTAARLIGVQPHARCRESGILTLAYGVIDGEVSLGALDMLVKQAQLEVYPIASRVGARGDLDHLTWTTVEDESLDVALMNPPFTRSATHEGEQIGIPNPAFAAFDTSDDDQREMARKEKLVSRGTAASGMAGLGSAFFALADKKVKRGGTIALILPLTFMMGTQWEKCRRLLLDYYEDITVVSIAGSSGTSMAFSEDTGMADCMVVARKSTSGKRMEGDEKRATFAILNDRPSSDLMGWRMAEEIRKLSSSGALARLEDGPCSGRAITFGEDVVGSIMSGPLPESGGWPLGRMADVSLPQTAYQLSKHARLWLAGDSKGEAPEIPMRAVRDIGKLGIYYTQVGGVGPKGDDRGPLVIWPRRNGSVPTYPVFWHNKASNERRIQFESESEGWIKDARCGSWPRDDMTEAEHEALRAEANRVLSTASHLHFNRALGFSSHALSMQFSEQKSIGGTAWQAISLPEVSHEKALALWGNTTPGLLVRWWHSSKQQAGRGIMGKTALYALPVLDVTALSEECLGIAVELFEEFAGREFLPVNEIDNDEARAELDERFGREVLGLPEHIFASDGPLADLRAKLASEPSIHGGKKGKGKTGAMAE